MTVKIQEFPIEEFPVESAPIQEFAIEEFPIEQEQKPSILQAAVSPFTEIVNKGLKARTPSSVITGAVTGNLETLGQGIQAAGRIIPPLKPMGETLTNDAETLRKKYGVEPSNLMEEFGQSAAGSLPLMAVGSAVGAGLGAVGVGAGTAAAVGAGSAAFVEATQNAGEARKRVLEKGGTPIDADKAAGKVFVTTLPVSAILNKITLFGQAGTALKRAAESFIGEATEEGWQQYMGNLAAKDPWFDGLIKAAAFGGIMGVGGGTISDSIQKAVMVHEQQKQAAPQQPPVQQEPIQEFPVDNTPQPTAQPATVENVPQSPEMQSFEQLAGQNPESFQPQPKPQPLAELEKTVETLKTEPKIEPTTQKPIVGYATDGLPIVDMKAEVKQEETPAPEPIKEFPIEEKKAKPPQSDYGLEFIYGTGKTPAVPEAADNTQEKELFEVERKGLKERYDLYKREAGIAMLPVSQQHKYAIEKLAEEAKLGVQRDLSRLDLPKQAEMATDGVQSFGRGKAGERDLLSIPEQQEPSRPQIGVNSNRPLSRYQKDIEWIKGIFTQGLKSYDGTHHYGLEGADRGVALAAIKNYEAGRPLTPKQESELRQDIALKREYDLQAALQQRDEKRKPKVDELGFEVEEAAPQKANIEDEIDRKYSQLNASPEDGSWERSASSNYARRIMAPTYKEIEKKPWKQSDGYIWTFPREARNNKQAAKRTVTEAIQKLNKLEMLDKAYDRNGEVYYAKKGTPVPEGMLSEKELPEKWETPEQFDDVINKKGEDDFYVQGEARFREKGNQQTLKDIRNKWNERGIQNYIAEQSNGDISLSEIRVPKEKRGNGLGTQAMEELIEYADSVGKRIVLSPDTSFGASSVNRLKDFYKRFGFVENKGRNKDFRISETMLRNPQSTKFRKGESKLQQFAAETEKAQSKATEDLLVKINNDLFGDGEVHFIDGVKNHPQALAAYIASQNKILIVKGQTRSEAVASMFHEAGHKFLNLVATDPEYSYVMDYVKAKHKEELDAERRKWESNPDNTGKEFDEDYYAEEIACEVGGKYAASHQGLIGKIKMIFDRIINRINKLFGYRNEIKLLYDNIESGAGRVSADTARTAGEAQTVYRERQSSRDEFTNRVKRLALENNLTPQEVGKAIVDVSGQKLFQKLNEDQVIKVHNALKSLVKEKLTKPIKTSEEAVKAFEEYKRSDAIREVMVSASVNPPANEGIVENPEVLKDITGFKGQFRDVYRNFEAVFGDGRQSDKIKKDLLDPFDKSKGDFVDEQQKLVDDLDKNIVQKYGFKKGSKESAAIMDFGEGKRDHLSLVKEFGAKKAQNIVDADKFFRAKYNELLDKVNASRKKVYGDMWQKKKDLDAEIATLQAGIDKNEWLIKSKKRTDTLVYLKLKRRAERLKDAQNRRIELMGSDDWWRGKVLPKRHDYYRHFKEMSDGFDGLINAFETPSGISPKLAGISPDTKPKSKFAGFMQKRTGEETERDAIGGYLNYAPSAAYAIHIDPNIKKFRELAAELATKTEESKNLNNFIEFLHDYANDLAGKTNPADRYLQKVVPGGRTAMRVINWANNRVKANTILGNASSSIAQIFNVPQAIGSTKQYAIGGATRTIAQVFAENGPMNKSDFIKERYSRGMYSKFDVGMLKNTKNFAAWMVGALDEVGTRFTWNAHYEKAVRTGIADPIKYADNMTRKMVAGRGVGEVPLGQKSKVFQLVAPFQLEVANTWWVMKDFMGEKDFAGIALMLIASWLMNRVAEKVRGSDVVFDPVNAIYDGYKAFMDEPNPMLGAAKFGGRLAGEALSNMPMGQTIAKMYPQKGVFGLKSKDLFGKGDPTRYGGGLLAVKGLQDPLFKLALPFGGGQIKKTWEGYNAISDGAVYKKDKKDGSRGDKMYDIPDTAGAKAQSLLFGKYATKNARDYFDGDKKKKSAAVDWGSF